MTRWWAAAALLVLAACAGSADSAEVKAERATLRVLAAASLTEAFTELESVHERRHPSIDVQLSYGSSAVLAQQVLEGAPADVLATADEATMARVTDEGLGDPRPLATNTLTLVTPPDDPGDVADITDLDSDGVSFAVCVPGAPCGQAAQQLLALDEVGATPATEQEDVKSVLTQVTSGQVDAGLVYVTDAQAAGDDVRTVAIDNASEVVSSYPITTLSGAAQPEAADDWVELVTSPRGRDVLASYGFSPPAT